MFPAFECLLNFCCVALLYVLFAIHHTHPKSFTVDIFLSSPLQGGDESYPQLLSISTMKVYST